MKAIKIDTVRESDADALTVAIYQDIKSTMGVALVNLVWRRLAIVPSVLDWSWQSLKPHYQSGAIPAAAWQLRSQIECPPVNAFTEIELARVLHEFKNTASIDDVLRTYERGNAQNLIALCYLNKCLNPGRQSGQSRESAVSQLSGELLNADRSTEQHADAVFGEIPSLPRLENLPAGMQELIIRCSNIWVPAKFNGLTPSVFKHLSHWPEFLTLVANRLEAVDRASPASFASLTTTALDSADGYAVSLSGGSTGLPELKPSDRLWLQDVLDMFIDGILARGVVIVPLLRTLLPKELR